MVIAFVRDDSSFLPEIKAYHRFFTQHDIQCINISYKDAKDVDADVLWYIMGFSASRRNVLTIHEYTSASAPPFARLKNFSKKWLTAKPDYRIFLNRYVKEMVSVNDGIPFGYRDMGIDFSVFYPRPESSPVYDFVYAGSVHHTRAIHRLLDCFAHGALRERTLLLLSKDYNGLAHTYSSASNIIFQGPVDQELVCTFMNQARFAVNFMPDIEPYNQQTSTKFLEYAACRVPVVTTSYPWIHQFKGQHGGSYYFLEKDLDNFTWEAVNGFHYEHPDLDEYAWENQIKASGVLRLLQQHFEALTF